MWRRGLGPGGAASRGAARSIRHNLIGLESAGWARVGPMRTASASTQVPAPPAEVFAFLADLENLPLWQNGIVSAQLTTPGEVGIDSRAHVVRDLMGQRLEVDVTVTDYEPDRRVQLESAASGIGVLATLDLEPVRDGTALTLRMEIRALNVFMAPIEGVVAGAAEQDLSASLDRIRAHFADAR
jgi:uncharacterized protein YndB with AHSA1/START domain